jgi:hypothetical protein
MKKMKDMKKGNGNRQRIGRMKTDQNGSPLPIKQFKEAVCLRDGIDPCSEQIRSDPFPSVQSVFQSL